MNLFQTSRIRYGEQTLEDIELLKSRYTTNFERNDWNDALHAFYSNKEVFDHNMRMLNDMRGDLFSFEAELPKGKKRGQSNDGTIDNTTFQQQLHLKKGALVMHISNTSIAEGLVNGVTGRVLNFAQKMVNSKPEIYAVIVKFDDPEIGKDTRKEYMNLHPDISSKNGVPIFRIKNSYRMEKKGSSKKTGKDLWLRQFPLTLAFGLTGK